MSSSSRTARRLENGLDGGAGDDTLFGPPADSTWTIDGANAGNVAGIDFSGIENLTGRGG